LKSVAIVITVMQKKCQHLKVGHCDPDYVSFSCSFGLLIFHSLRFIYMLNLHHVALGIREIFTGVCKLISRSPKLGHVPFDLVFACHKNYSS